MARRKHKLLLSLLVMGAVGSVASWGMYSAFSATTTNSGNTITAGTVAIGQHAGAATLYAASNQGPGSSVQKCVRVQYTGSLASAVKLYSSGGFTNPSAFTIQVERGSGLTTLDNTMSCAGFTSASVALAATTLDNLPTSYAGGIDGKAAAAAWSQNDAVDYRFTLSVVDDSTPNARSSAKTSGSHTFTWEARNN